MNWLVGSRGSITLSFSGVNVLNDDDRKTVPTPVQILAMPCHATACAMQSDPTRRRSASCSKSTSAATGPKATSLATIN